MKSVLCFGDSNTWAYNPETGTRYPYEIRWTSVLQKALGDSWTIIPEGFNGRTTVFSDPFMPYRNGLEFFPAIIGSHYPLDILIIMLGTNDTKSVFDLPVHNITGGLEALIKAARGKAYGINGGDPKILIVSPAIITEGDQNKAVFDLRQFQGSAEKSIQFGAACKALAQKTLCSFFDASKIAFSSSIDGIHLTPESHKTLGLELAALIKRL
ncbi:MAG: SGNH/GDSL hydrolase family protein [Spirochaetaceae bacterium]|jgi:lysophospholipase L1-like esterase|nr:SGNH/GDSL hydrolase family protein [Spirochaetaceae bacterium]